MMKTKCFCKKNTNIRKTCRIWRLIALFLFIAGVSNANEAFIDKGEKIQSSDNSDINTPTPETLSANELYNDLQSSKKKRISGTIKDEKGEPLIGVTIAVKGTTTGVVTNFDGMFVIDVPEDATLSFSYVGFVKQEIKVGKDEIINVTMEEDTNSLKEVVVVGFGTQKKESIVGSITTVQPEKLRVSSSRSVSNALAGQISGIIGVQRSGEPGYDNSSFWIRGISTFAGNRSPLVLVDGIERSLNNIEPQEIESFSVLKDAAASAVYGVRGANGVILINTKRGKIGKPTVMVRTEYAITQPVRLPEYLGAADYLQLMDDIRVDNGGSAIYGDRINKTRTGWDPELYPDVDWMDAITKDNASNFRTTVDISGGSEKLRYSFVAAFYNESGILERDKSNDWDSSIKLQRYNVRSNVDLDLTSTTLLRFNIGGYMQDRNYPPESIDNIFSEAFVNPPFVHPTRYSTGEIPRVMERTNPWALATQRGYERGSQSKIESLFSIEQDLKMLLPGLRIKGVFSFDRYSTTSVKRDKTPYYHNPATGRDDDGNLILTLLSGEGQDFLQYSKGAEWGDKSTYLEGNVSYSQTFDKHAVDAMFMYNQRHYDNGDKLPFRNQGIAGRLSYIFNSRYVGEFNFGYNGSENFAKGKRYGFFPSVAVGWIISEESFMSSISKTMNKLKLRGSIGKAGNDRLDGRRFAYLTTIGGYANAYTWGYNKEWVRNGRQEGDIGVPTMTWETVTKTNLGLEVGLWNNMIDLQVDVFKEKRKDIFMQRRSLPATVGIPVQPWDNYGKVDNKGIDISLNFNKSITKDLFISFLGTFTYAKNKIIETDEPFTVIGTNRSTTNRPVGQTFGLIAEGLFIDDDFADIENGVLKDGIPRHTFSATLRPGDIKYKDVNNDGIIDANDNTAIGGTFDPEIVYGFGLNLKYKNLDFGFLFQGNGRTYRIIGQGSSYFIPGSGNGALGNIFDNVNDRWTTGNPSQDVFYPRLQMGYNANNSQASSWWLRNMSMLRMRNIELGYTLPRHIANSAFLNNARFFVRGNNLLTFSKFKLWDPEIDTSTGAKYPMMKTFSFGFEINF
ncbi:TonB-dependent receptor [Prevotella sp. 10(H)]|uniref:SusC/RagA family TonB-linked outer membrane protein n=1 Tax=Prevotella sp. 10(H) TaxID=1158294 RepID=UPI000B2673B7|nr:TonB-dependent receptor [Prevotella sp. 10(H)]